MTRASIATTLAGTQGGPDEHQQDSVETHRLSWPMLISRQGLY